MNQAESIEAFPLQWPQGFERSVAKKNSQFKCTLAQARDGILNQIRMLKGSNAIISSNVPIKRDGQMYANLKPVDGDTGIAVYFTWKNDQYVLACDTYHYLHENLRAIEKSIQAIRDLERHGCSDILARAFTGFKALNEAPKQSYWSILSIDQNAGRDEVNNAYRKMAKKYHPDNKETGDHEMFIKVKAAYDSIIG